jgi:hypothetical protein
MDICLRDRSFQLGSILLASSEAETGGQMNSDGGK